MLNSASKKQKRWLKPILCTGGNALGNKQVHAGCRCPAKLTHLLRSSSGAPHRLETTDILPSPDSTSSNGNQVEKKKKKKERNGNVASLSSLSLSLMKPWLTPLFLAKVSMSKDLHTHCCWLKQPFHIPPSAQQHSKTCLSSGVLDTQRHRVIVQRLSICTVIKCYIWYMQHALILLIRSNKNPFISEKLILI